ncbi:MAG: LysR family transcriptional regulator [Alphaproteobacteria bacterium]|nr:LysR family transcriptional regulator [Alphaproteobacteria bacterium]
MVDWDKLRVFYHVAKAKSFNRAAHNLNISQSALSRSIQLLEHLLKVQLFNRVPRGLVLTKQGEILFEKAKEMFVSLEDAKSAIQAETKEPKGSLKVASTVALASLWLVEILPGFLKLYPEIEFDIIGHDENLDVKAREADVAIRPFIEGQPDLIQQYLFSCFLQLYASPQYIKKFGCPSTVHDLDNHRIITFGESTIRPYGDIDWPLRIGVKANHMRKPYISINSSKGACRLAELGLGIVALSKEFPGIEKLNLINILPDIKGPVVDLYYVYPAALKSSKRVQEFGKFLSDTIPSHSKNVAHKPDQRKAV